MTSGILSWILFIQPLNCHIYIVFDKSVINKCTKQPLYKQSMGDKYWEESQWRFLHQFTFLSETTKLLVYDHFNYIN